jgi:hypothetical protein
MHPLLKSSDDAGDRLLHYMIFDRWNRLLGGTAGEMIDRESPLG